MNKDNQRLILICLALFMLFYVAMDGGAFDNIPLPTPTQDTSSPPQATTAPTLSPTTSPTSEPTAEYNPCLDPSAHCNPLNQNSALNPNHDLNAPNVYQWDVQRSTYQSPKGCRQSRTVQAPSPYYDWHFNLSGNFCGSLFKGFIPDVFFSANEYFNVNISYLSGRVGLQMPIHAQPMNNYTLTLRYRPEITQVIGSAPIEHNLREYCILYVDDSSQYTFEPQSVDALRALNEITVSFRTLSYHAIQAECGVDITYGVFDGQWRVDAFEWQSVAWPDSQMMRIIP